MACLHSQQKDTEHSTLSEWESASHPAKGEGHWGPGWENAKEVLNGTLRKDASRMQADKLHLCLLLPELSC